MLGSNSYYDATDWRAKVTGSSSLLQLTGGNFALQMANSVSAGAALTYTAVLTNQGVGQTLALQGASSSAGVGIAFPGTQVASSNANTLDDYEEGTWTPEFLALSGSVTVTYGNRYGRYTKIGNLVYADFLLAWTARSGGDGLLAISMPFAPNAGGGAHNGASSRPHSASTGATPSVKAALRTYALNHATITTSILPQPRLVTRLG
jgi:hypothetical protein